MENLYARNVYSNMCTRFLDFSKIADLQARSTALGAALRACRSAIFQWLKHETMVTVVKAKVTRCVSGVNGLFHSDLNSILTFVS